MTVGVISAVVVLTAFIAVGVALSQTPDMTEKPLDTALTQLSSTPQGVPPGPLKRHSPLWVQWASR